MKNISAKIFLFLVSITIPLKADFSSFIRPDIGFLKYHILTTHFLDASNNPDYIKSAKTKITPLMRLSLGFEDDDLGMLRSNNRTTGRIGLSVQYAKKGDGVTGDYYDHGFVTSSFLTQQTIKRVDGLLFLEYDFARLYGLDLTLGAGAGIATGVLKDLKLYERSNNAFLGQSLKPHALSPSGYLSFSSRKSLESVPSLTYGLGYQLGIAGVRYKALVAQSQPDPSSGVFAQNAFNLLSDISLAKPPRFTVFSNQFTFSVECSF